MTLKEAARLLGCSRETVRTALLEGVKGGDPPRLIKLRGQELGTEWDITDEELDSFISAHEAADPGRHPPLGVRRALLVECAVKCGICRSDAPLQFHHIVPWTELKHHDPQHMLAVCGTCHDKITRTGQVDRDLQFKFKSRLSTEPPLARSLPVAVPELSDRSEPRRVIIDQGDEERLVYLTPRGLVLLEDVAFTTDESWCIQLHYFEFRSGWRHGTHYHSSYYESWTGANGGQIQMQKMGIPRADWPYVGGVLYVAERLRDAVAPSDLQCCAEEHRKSGRPVFYYAANADIVSDELPAWDFGLRGTNAMRDLIADAEVYGEPGDDLGELADEAERIRHRASRVVEQEPGITDASRTVITKLLDEYPRPSREIETRAWLRRLCIGLTEAVRPL